MSINNIVTDELSPELSELFRGAYRRTTALHLTPVTATTPADILQAAATNPAGSRVGGAALITPEHPWPLDSKQQPMIHLAQLNLAELPLRDGYPTSGLLQFFIADDDVMGLDFSDSDNYRGHVVRLIPAQLFPSATVEYHPPQENDGFITGGFFTVTGQLYDQAPCIEDRDFEKLNLGLTEEETDELYDRLEHEYQTIFGGGWAHFTQFDPRSNDDHREILFQLDTYFGTDGSVELMWGDAGIGNFFISKEDLANLDFSNVLYNWDCC